MKERSLKNIIHILGVLVGISFLVLVITAIAFYFTYRKLDISSFTDFVKNINSNVDILKNMISSVPTLYSMVKAIPTMYYVTIIIDIIAVLLSVLLFKKYKKGIIDIIVYGSYLIASGINYSFITLFKTLINNIDGICNTDLTNHLFSKVTTLTDDVKSVIENSQTLLNDKNTFIIWVVIGTIVALYSLFCLCIQIGNKNKKEM